MPPPAGPLVQKQITVIQVPTLDKSKDKANRAVVEISKDELLHAVVSIDISYFGFFLGGLHCSNAGGIAWSVCVSVGHIREPSKNGLNRLKLNFFKDLNEKMEMPF